MSDIESQSGFILINKHSGPTSHDIVDQLRQITKIKKIGHAGTLDPLASGLLIVAIGREATKQIDQFVKLDKEYLVEIRLGIKTDTYDQEGKVLERYEGSKIAKKDVKKAVKKFIGHQEQLPPMYSAKKVKGKKLYELARAGKDIARQPSKIKINKLKIVSYGWPKLELKVHCSSGTYIRSLAHDLGHELGCGATMWNLQRIKIGPFSLKQALELSQLNSRNWVDYLLSGF